MTTKNLEKIERRNYLKANIEKFAKDSNKTGLSFFQDNEYIITFAYFHPNLVEVQIVDREMKELVFDEFFSLATETNKMLERVSNFLI